MASLRGLLVIGCVMMFKGADTDDAPSVKDLLKGRKFRIKTIPTPPYTMPIERYIEHREGTVVYTVVYKGYIPDLMHELCTWFNMDCEISHQEDGKQGEYNVTSGTWDGMIGELKRWEKTDGAEGADIAAAPISISSMNEAHIDLVQVFPGRGFVMVKWKPPPESITFYRPFLSLFLSNLEECFTAGSVLVIALIVSLTIWGIHKLVGRFSTLEENANLGAGDCFWFTFTTLSWQGYSKAPTQVGARTLSAFWFCFIVLFMASWTASSINKLDIDTVSAVYATEGGRYQSLEDVVMDTSRHYDYGTVGSGYVHQYIRNSTNPIYSIMARHWTGGGFWNLVSNEQEGIERAVRDHGYIFITSEMTAKYLIQRQPCNLQRVGRPFGREVLGFGMPAGHPLTERIRTAVQELQENQLLSALENRWWYENGECGPDTDPPSGLAASQVNLVNLGPVWTFLAFGIVLSLILTIIDSLLLKKRGRGLCGVKKAEYKANDDMETNQL